MIHGSWEWYRAFLLSYVKKCLILCVSIGVNIKVNKFITLYIIHLLSARLSEMQFLITPKFTACCASDVGLEFVVSRQKQTQNPNDLASLWATTVFCLYPLH